MGQCRVLLLETLKPYINGNLTIRQKLETGTSLHSQEKNMNRIIFGFVTEVYSIKCWMFVLEGVQNCQLLTILVLSNLWNVTRAVLVNRVYRTPQVVPEFSSGVPPWWGVQRCTRYVLLKNSHIVSQGVQTIETTFIWDLFIWNHIHLRPHSFETAFIWDLFIWDHIHLSPYSFETTVIWDHSHLRPHSFETTFILDHIHFRPHSF